MSRKALQITNATLSLIPLATGAATLLGISDPLYAALHLPRAPLLDSNLRFFGGVWLALGVALLWTVRRIDTETALYRTLWGAVFLGGVGRLLSMLLVGLPPWPFVGFTLLEVIGAPLMVAWQRHRMAHP